MSFGSRWLLLLLVQQQHRQPIAVSRHALYQLASFLSGFLSIEGGYLTCCRRLGAPYLTCQALYFMH